MTYHRLAVAKARAQRHARLMARFSPYTASWYTEPRQLGRFRKTRVACSCPWCGHRRALMGPPVQELRITSGNESLRIIDYTDGTA